MCVGDRIGGVRFTQGYGTSSMAWPRLPSADARGQRIGTHDIPRRRGRLRRLSLPGTSKPRDVDRGLRLLSATPARSQLAAVPRTHDGVELCRPRCSGGRPGRNALFRERLGANRWSLGRRRPADKQEGAGRAGRGAGRITIGEVRPKFPPTRWTRGAIASCLVRVASGAGVPGRRRPVSIRPNEPNRNRVDAPSNVGWVGRRVDWKCYRRKSSMHFNHLREVIGAQERTRTSTACTTRT